MLKRLAMMCVLTMVAVPAMAQGVVVQGGPPPALRKNLDAFKTAVNGTAEQYETMAKTVFDAALFKAQTPAERKADFDRMRAFFGKLEFNNIQRNGGPDAPLQVFVKGSANEGVIWIGIDDATSKFISVKPEIPVKKHEDPRH
jgi:hypothetical protein